jgi:hypothetical protein
MPKKKHKTMWTDQTMNPIDVQERIDGYLEMLQSKMNNYWKLAGFTHDEPPVISCEYGKKYAKVIYADYSGPSRSVHTFVNMLNGDILKSGSWKAPAPNGVRGNIFEDDFGASVTNEYGASYLRGPSW